MSKKSKHTPRSRIRSALRNVWLRSRERAACLKRDGYTCQICGKKQTMAKGKVFKVQVHHLNGIEWEYLIDEVYKHLLCNPDNLQTICKPCHDGVGDV
jgi:5-methylcytosine-specific restriction endonuclease McrA